MYANMKKFLLSLATAFSGQRKNLRDLLFRHKF